jgi:tetratricopeptide (TPR) repeat protein
MLNADRTTWTFGQLLNWNLERGTRPEGEPDSKGVPWQNKAFALAVGKESPEGPKNERTIRNWRNGDTTPSPPDFAAILRALFGGKPAYADARAELTEAYHRKRVEDEAEADSSTPQLSSLPTKPLRCLGRDDDLRAVVEALVAPRDDTAVLVLGGPGMGKTTVTRQAAVDPAVVEKFSQRRWFVELETATNAEALEKAIIVALGLDPAAARFDAALAQLAEAPGLLVLDNLETPWDGEREKVEALLTTLHRLPGLVLLASIRGNDSPAGVRWTRRRTMHPLEPPHDRELFLDMATDIKADDPDLDLLLTTLGGIPIAIELVAHLATPHDSLHAIHAEWQRVGVALAKRRGVEPSRLSSLEVSLELSFQSDRLGDAGRRLFAILGQLPAGIAADDVDALLATEAFSARQGLLASGLGFERSDRLDLLPPLRDHALRQHPPSSVDTSLLHDHYFALAHANDDRMTTADGAVAVRRVAAELPNLDAAIRAAIAAGSIELGIMAMGGIVNTMAATGLGTTVALSDLASACRKASDTVGEARLMNGIGYVALFRSNHEAARQAYEQALSLYRKACEIHGEANCIKSLGDIALARSDYEVARRAYERALILYRKLPDILGEANCVQSLGEIALRRADHEVARNAYEQALPLYRQIGDILGEANCVQSLGQIALRLSGYEAAQEIFEQALPLYRQVGDVLGEANCIMILGDIALGRSDYETARIACEGALSLFRQVGDILGQANCIQSLGDIACARSDHKTAHKAYGEALALYATIPEPYSIGVTHLRLALVSENAESAGHRAAAREAWRSIGRDDLVKKAGL